MTIAALLLAAMIFAVDVFTRFDGAVAVLYTAVVLLVAPAGRRVVMAAGAGTAVLALTAFVAGHIGDFTDGALSRLAVSLTAIAITTVLSIRDRASRTTLGEQARILELSHDTVIIRDPDDIILFWNDGAEHLYGWTRKEAVGRNCSELLQCEFPRTEVGAALEETGHWSGELVRSRRDGTRLVLASRWLLRRDPDGRPVGVIESSADLTRQRIAAAQVEASERRYRTIFDAAGFAAWESDCSGTNQVLAALPAGTDLGSWLRADPDRVRQAFQAAVVLDANSAAVALFEAQDRTDIVGTSITARYLPESTEALIGIFEALTSGQHTAESEVRLATFSGRVVDVVLRITRLPAEGPYARVLVMAFDVTERNEARARVEQISAELAHAARVSMLGQLAASIAHEVNQPLAAIVNYGKSARRWLRRAQPDLDEVSSCVDKMLSNATRAAEVVSHVRAMARKEVAEAQLLDLSELIEDAIALVQREARIAGTKVRRTGSTSLPPVLADKVQVQQVMMNLLLNAIHAMQEVRGRPRELCIETSVSPTAMARVAVIDCGVGFAPGGEAKLFEPFFTTKPNGMGMGLSICKSLIEAQGGRIFASNNDGFGATVAFTLPLAEGRREGDLICSYSGKK